LSTAAVNKNEKRISDTASGLNKFFVLHQRLQFSSSRSREQENGPLSGKAESDQSGKSVHDIRSSSVCHIFVSKYSDLKTISPELGKLPKKITCSSVVYCRNVR
jgi:hypothetical protein